MKSTLINELNANNDLQNCYTNRHKYESCKNIMCPKVSSWKPASLLHPLSLIKDLKNWWDSMEEISEQQCNEHESVSNSFIDYHYFAHGSWSRGRAILSLPSNYGSHEEQDGNNCSQKFYSCTLDLPLKISGYNQLLLLLLSWNNNLIKESPNSKEGRGRVQL